MTKSDHRLGLLYVGCAAAAWSFGGLLTRLIRADSWTMITWRGLFGAAGLAAVMLVQRDRGALRSLAAMGWLGWLFVAQSAAGMIFYLAALRNTSVANVAVIYATAPFMTAALGWAMMRERPTTSALGASAAALAGVAVMVGFGARGGWAGDLLALGMTLSMAVATVVARFSKDLPIVPTACLSALLSAVLAWPLGAPAGVSGRDLGLIALFGILNFGIGVPLFAAGARLLPAIETALLGSVEAPLAPLWVGLAIGEMPGRSTFIGGSIVFAAVAVHLTVTQAKAVTRTQAVTQARVRDSRASVIAVNDDAGSRL
ncbi:MAG: DMT family transporter [Steroidobacteraceae bacterium]|jgi:drug/metabolite transporter (DMT)-like permease